MLAGEEIEGLRSSLYTYQRRSVAAMIQKETRPADIPDPLFIPIVGINGREFYMQPSTMEILQERPMVQQNRGGVLCEELGKSNADIPIIHYFMFVYPRDREDYYDISFGPCDH